MPDYSTFRLSGLICTLFAGQSDLGLEELGKLLFSGLGYYQLMCHGMPGEDDTRSRHMDPGFRPAVCLRLLSSFQHGPIDVLRRIILLRNRGDNKSSKPFLLQLTLDHVQGCKADGLRRMLQGSQERPRQTRWWCIRLAWRGFVYHDEMPIPMQRVVNLAKQAQLHGSADRS